MSPRQNLVRLFNCSQGKNIFLPSFFPLITQFDCNRISITMTLINGQLQIQICPLVVRKSVVSFIRCYINLQTLYRGKNGNRELGKRGQRLCRENEFSCVIVVAGLLSASSTLALYIVNSIFSWNLSTAMCVCAYVRMFLQTSTFIIRKSL